MGRMRLMVAFAVLVGTLLTALQVSADDTWRDGWRRIVGPDGIEVLPQDLSINDVRHMMEHHVAWEYGGRLKLGIVKEKDADTIIVELVTPESYLVKRVEVNRHTGWMRPAR